MRWKSHNNSELEYQWYGSWGREAGDGSPSISPGIQAPLPQSAEVCICLQLSRAASRWTAPPCSKTIGCASSALGQRRQPASVSCAVQPSAFIAICCACMLPSQACPLRAARGPHKICSLQRCCCLLQVVLSFRAQQTKFQDEMERLKTENVRIQNEADDKVSDSLQLLALSVVISGTDIVRVQMKAASFGAFCRQLALLASCLCLALLGKLVGTLHEQYAMKVTSLQMAGRSCCSCRGTTAAPPDLQLHSFAAAYMPVRQSSNLRCKQSPDCWLLLLIQLVLALQRWAVETATAQAAAKRLQAVEGCPCVGGRRHLLPYLHLCLC